MNTTDKNLRSHLATALDSRAEFTNSANVVAGTDALRALTALEGEIADARAGLIAALRANGESWSQIGNALGISKQAAQQRYGAERL